MSIVSKISCAHCGAPIQFQPGEIVATCRYCGFTQVIETGKSFDFEHSMFLNKFDMAEIEGPVWEWMRSGFTKPKDLKKKSQISEKKLSYIPFWVFDIHVESTYKGIFERLTPPVLKDGNIEKSYNWLVIARKATQFPTVEYDIPLEGKIPYDFRKIEGFAEVLNSEVDKVKAIERAKQEIGEHHKFLVKKQVDKIIEINTKYKFGRGVYLHAPIWFIVYQYEEKRYKVIADGATGKIIKADIPPIKFSLF